MSAHIKRMARANQLAAQYLKSNPHLSANTGYVVLWKMKPFGWICDLNRPQDKRPGVLAVAPSSQVFQATGGDYWKGATEWSMIWSAPAVMTQGEAKELASFLAARHPARTSDVDVMPQELCDDDRVSPAYEEDTRDPHNLGGI